MPRRPPSLFAPPDRTRARGRAFFAGLSLAVSAFSACASPPPPTPPPPPPPAAPEPVLVEPDQVLLSARWRQAGEPSALAAPAIDRWLPRDFGPFASTSEGALKHLVAAVRPNGRNGFEIVMAIATSLENFDWSRPPPGARVAADGRSRLVTLRSGAACALVPPPESQVICSRQAEHLQALLAVASKHAARVLEPDQDLAADVRPALLAQTFGQRLRGYTWTSLLALLDVESRNAAFDRAFERALSGATQDALTLASELESVQLSAGPDPSSDGRVRLTLSAWFSGHRSALGDWVLHAERGAVPDLFRQLPGSSTLSVFGSGTPSERLAGAKTFAADLLAGMLSYQGTPRRLQNEAANLIRALPLPRAGFAYASGPATSSATIAEHDLDGRGAQELVEAVGWHLMVVKGPADRYKTFLHQLLRTYGDPVLGPQLARILRAQGELWAPLSLRRRATTRGFGPEALVVDAVLPARVYDPRHERYEVTRDKGISLTLAVVPQGELTFIGLAAQDELLRSVLPGRRGERSAALGPPPRAPFDGESGEGLLAGGVIQGPDAAATATLEATVATAADRRRLDLRASLDRQRLLQKLPWLEPALGGR